MPKKVKMKPGPEPLYGAEKMKNKLIVMLTEEHSQRIRAAARQARQSQSAWARDILLQNAPELTDTNQKDS